MDLTAYIALHSNMFLLIHMSKKWLTMYDVYFTFQYVSINTNKDRY